MRIIVSNKVKRMTFVVTLIVIVIVIITVIVYNTNKSNNNYITTALSIDNFKMRNDLLLEAIDSLGVCKPEEAAKVWSNGLRLRNAAMQYSVLNKDLKGKYIDGIEKSFPNWITGTSSPWIDSYNIKKTTKKNINNYIYIVEFITKTSTGPAGNYLATLNVTKENNFWYISNIVADKELYPFIGYNF